jgi:hypothetical protein
LRGVYRYWGYKKGYLVKIKGISSKNRVFLLEKCIGRGVKKKDFGRYLSISSKIRGII